MHIKNKILILIIFLSVFGFIKVADAAIYYVSPTGSDSNPGTQTAPWQTLAKAVGVASPGDTVYFRTGTYSGGSLNKSGTSGSPITFQAYSGETPLFNGSIRISGRYITVRGVEVKGTINVYGNYAVIDRVHVHNARSSGVWFDATSYGTITNSTLHDFYDYGSGGTGGGGNSDCIAAGSGTGASQFDRSAPPYGYNTIKNNLLYNCSDDGIDMWTSQYNTIEGNIAHHAGYSNAADGGSNSIGERVGDGNGFKLGIGGNNTIKNNVAYSNAAAGFDNNGGVNNVVYNNTSYNNGIAYRSFTGTSTVKNNIAVGSTSTSGYDHNSWNLGISNPRFVSTDPSSPNFLRLSPDSPAINVGVNVGLPYNGSAPDLGTYEYGGTGGGTTPTPTPSTSSTPTPTPSATPTPTPGTLRGDLNNDRIVNSLDWSLMNAKWFTNDATADLNSDGIVNSLDFSIMNGNWLRASP